MLRSRKEEVPVRLERVDWDTDETALRSTDPSNRVADWIVSQRWIQKNSDVAGFILKEPNSEAENKTLALLDDACHKTGYRGE